MTPSLIRTVAFASIALIAVAAPGAQQTSPPQPAPAAAAGTGQLGGVVVASDGSDQPIRRAFVRISAPELRGTRQIATDDRGRFLFTDLPAGRFQMSASKPGYVNTSYGQRRVRGTGTPISLASGQRELTLRMALTKGAVVTGRVTDEFGQPVPGARLEIAERSIVSGQMTTSFVSSNNAMTDDRGAYRIYGLPAGTYLVSISNLGQLARAILRPTSAGEVQWAMREAASAGPTGAYSTAPPANQNVAFASVFHPSAIDAGSATPVEVEAGAERNGVDIVIRFVPVATVAGAVTMPDGTPALAATVVLVATTSSGEAMTGMDSMQNSRTTARGEFSFESVRSGLHAVMVQASSRSAGGRAGGPPDLWGQTTVTVDGRDVQGVTVMLQPGLSFGGRIVVDPESTLAPPDLTQARVSLQPAQRSAASFGVAPAAISPDGSFAMSGAAPGSYRMTITPPMSGNTPGAVPVWATKSVMIHGRNVIDRPFEIRPGEHVDGVVITLTDRITALIGKLLDEAGKPAVDYTVVVFPADRALWVQGIMSGPRSTRPANDGAFRFNALPPGEYYVVAATDVDSRVLYNAGFLEELIPAAMKLTIADGEKKQQDLKIAR